MDIAGYNGLTELGYEHAIARKDPDFCLSLIALPLYLSVDCWRPIKERLITRPWFISETKITVTADSAVIVVITPAEGAVRREGRRLMANDIVEGSCWNDG